MEAVSSLKTSNDTHLWFLTLTYTVIIILSNWFDARLVQLSFFVTDAGTLVFPLSFLLANVITEVYGLNHAKRAIWCGFLFNSVFILYAQLIIHLPSPDFQTQNAAYDTVLALNFRILIASMMSYLVCEPLNAYLTANLKMNVQGKFMIASMIAATLDSILFSFLAFYHQMPFKDLVHFILTMCLIKLCIETCFLPFSVYLTKWLTRSKCKAITDI